MGNRTPSTLKVKPGREEEGGGGYIKHALLNTTTYRRKKRRVKKKKSVTKPSAASDQNNQRVLRAGIIRDESLLWLQGVKANRFHVEHPDAAYLRNEMEKKKKSRKQEWLHGHVIDIIINMKHRNSPPAGSTGHAVFVYPRKKKL